MEEELQNIHCFLKKLHAYKLQEQVTCRDGMLQPLHSSIAKMKSGHELSEVLFEELLKRFENLRALLTCQMDGAFDIKSQMKFALERFIMLLRCCLAMLQFLEFDMSLLWEKCGVIFKILYHFCPLNLVPNACGCNAMTSGNSSLQCHSCFLRGINKEADLLFSFFPMILEVFITEFSKNVGLRKLLISVNLLTAKSEKICAYCKSHSDDCPVVKLVLSDFLRNDPNFSSFLLSFSGSNNMDKIIPDISLDASLKYLNSPFFFYTPLILQEHIILLASKCVSTHLPIDGRKSDSSMMSCFLNSFQLSIKLYLFYLPTLQLDAAALRASGRSNLGFTASSSDTNAFKMVWGKLTDQENDLADFCYCHSVDTLSGTKSDVISYSAAFIRENHPLIDPLCKEATCSLVNYIIDHIFPREVWTLKHSENNEGKIGLAANCLAVTMKLMNCSLLHILLFLRQSECHNEVIELTNFSPSLTYECLFQSVNAIRNSGCGVDDQVQNILDELSGSYGVIHHDIMFILAHFSSFLVYSFRKKVDFLWKGCISLMVTFMNLLLIKDGNQGLSKIFELLRRHSSIDNMVSTYRSTSVLIAKNLEKTRLLHLKNENNYVHAEENGWLDVQRDACNGESFIKCNPSYRRNPSEWDDLVDFIECSPDKDYSSWLNNRNKFRKWKQQKASLFKTRKKRKMAAALTRKVYNLRAR